MMQRLSRVWAALDRAIRAAALPCEALPGGITVDVDDDTNYEPDAIVNCGPELPEDAIAATNPVIVVEVLSPANQSIDAGDKLADYFRVASVRHYLIFRARRREVIHHRRAGAEIVTKEINPGAIRLDPPVLRSTLPTLTRCRREAAPAVRRRPLRHFIGRRRAASARFSAETITSIPCACQRCTAL